MLVPGKYSTCNTPSCSSSRSLVAKALARHPVLPSGPYTPRIHWRHIAFDAQLRPMAAVPRREAGGRAVWEAPGRYVLRIAPDRMVVFVSHPLSTPGRMPPSLIETS
jgi:hypothetical protein